MVITRHEQLTVLKQGFLVIGLALLILANLIHGIREHLLDMELVDDLLCKRKVLLHGRQKGRRHIAGNSGDVVSIAALSL